MECGSPAAAFPILPFPCSLRDASLFSLVAWALLLEANTPPSIRKQTIQEGSVLI